MSTQHMTTPHHPDDQKNVPDRPARCLRHHVWMAACADCRDARIPRQRAA